MIDNLIHADCATALGEIGDSVAQLVLTDPPYGISYQSARRTEWQRKDKIANDDKPAIDWLPEAYRITKDGGSLLCFCRWDVQDALRSAIEGAGFKVRSQIIWDKVVHGMGDLTGEFGPQHEVIWFATKGKFQFPGKRPTTVFRTQRVSPGDLSHPNEKPVDLLGRLIEATTEGGDLVVDPFAGSGSTLYAAKRLGRRYLGIEIDEKYVQIANSRLAQEVLL